MPREIDGPKYKLLLTLLPGPGKVSLEGRRALMSEIKGGKWWKSETDFEVNVRYTLIEFI